VRAGPSLPADPAASGATSSGCALDLHLATSSWTRSSARPRTPDRCRFQPARPLRRRQQRSLTAAAGAWRLTWHHAGKRGVFDRDRPDAPASDEQPERRSKRLLSHQSGSHTSLVRMGSALPPRTEAGVIRVRSGGRAEGACERLSRANSARPAPRCMQNRQSPLALHGCRSKAADRVEVGHLLLGPSDVG
jgi:hypothetical protein